MAVQCHGEELSSRRGLGKVDWSEKGLWEVGGSQHRLELRVSSAL